MQSIDQSVKKRRTRRNTTETGIKEMTQIDSTEARLNEHEKICSLRYAGIETKMSQIDKKFDRIETDIKEIRDASLRGFGEIKELIEKRQNASHTAIITSAGAIIVALIGFLGYLLTHLK